MPYSAWVRDGHLIALPGRSLDYAFVVKDMADWLAEDDAALAFDTWRIEDFMRALDEDGIESWLYEGPDEIPGEGLRMVRHGQGFGGGASDKTLWMPRSITQLEDAILQGRLKVKKNPVLTWCNASAVVAQDASDNQKGGKRKATGRIAGVVALSMAVGIVMAAEAEVAEPMISIFADGPPDDPDGFFPDEDPWHG